MAETAPDTIEREPAGVGSDLPAGQSAPTVDFSPTPAPADTAGGIVADVESRTENTRQGLLGAFREKDRHMTVLDREQESRLEADRAKYERAYRAEGAAKDAIPPPWNADKERADRIRGPMEQFGSVGSVFAMAASMFTRTPMTSALNAGAAAMNAIREHDEKGYESAYKAWLDNTNLAIKRFDMEHTMLADADKLMHTDMQAWAAKRLGIASHFENTTAMTMLQNGMYPELLQMEAAALKGRQDVEKFKTQYLLDYELPRQAIERSVQAFKDEWAVNHPDEPEGSPAYNRAYFQNYAKTLQSINAAKHAYSASAQTVATFEAMKGDVRAEHPEWTEGEVDREVVRRMSADKGAGRQGSVLSKDRDDIYQTKLREIEEKEGRPPTAKEKEDAMAAATKKTQGSRIDQAIVNQVGHYPGMKESDLGYIPVPRQTKLAAAFESARNLEDIAAYARQYPQAIGLIAEASRRMNVDAYQGLFSKSPTQAKEQSEKDRDAVGRARVEQRPLAASVPCSPWLSRRPKG